MANYHNGMTREAQVMARETQIAAGWLQGEATGARYQIGCNECGFYSAERISAGELNQANIDQEPLVQRRVRSDFETRAAQNGCVHWPAYLNLLRDAKERLRQETSKSQHP